MGAELPPFTRCKAGAYPAAVRIRDEYQRMIDYLKKHTE